MLALFAWGISVDDNGSDVIAATQSQGLSYEGFGAGIGLYLLDNALGRDEIEIAVTGHYHAVIWLKRCR